ncbi:hypothetical protein ACQ4PT_001061 [Festuca glaucescens]
MVLTMSLIHANDMSSMDDDALRRGRLANHVTFGEFTALLSGDNLLPLEHLACGCAELGVVPAERVRAMAELGNAAGMAAGHVADQRPRACPCASPMLETWSTSTYTRPRDSSRPRPCAAPLLVDGEIESIRLYASSVGLLSQPRSMRLTNAAPGCSVASATRNMALIFWFRGAVLCGYRPHTQRHQRRHLYLAVSTTQPKPRVPVSSPPNRIKPPRSPIKFPQPLFPQIPIPSTRSPSPKSPATMGNPEKLMAQIFDLKFTSKSLQRQARKCEKEEKEQKLKVKKAIEKGNVDGARIYAENAIRKRTEHMNYLRLASRLDAVVARLDTQAKMQAIGKSMGNIVKSLDSSLATGNLQKMSETMDNFERQFVNMEVQAEFMEGAMAGSTSLSTPETEVNSLMQQVADDYGLEVSVGLPQAAAHAIPAAKDKEKVDEDDLTRRLAELKARG